MKQVTLFFLFFLQQPIFRVYAVIPNNSKRECFLRSSPLLLPTKRKSPAGSCGCRGFELRWKNLESQQRGYWERTRERCRERENREVIDSVGDREWNWGRKLKEKSRKKEWTNEGRVEIQVGNVVLDLQLLFHFFTHLSSLLHPLLPLTFLILLWFFYCAPLHLFFFNFKQSTTLHLILFWNNSFFTQTHTGAYWVKEW